MPHSHPLPRILAVAVAASLSFTTTGVRAQDDGLKLEEVYVTARRTSENLQDVPVSVQVISGSTIDELAMTTPEELSKLTPGLTLRLPEPQNPVIILRGVRWVQASGTPATPIYLNEISFDPVQVMQTMYDYGQAEVLRGPQGTSRGAPSISGAITFTTRRPDLQEFGGYVSGLGGGNDHYNTQGAINIPIIEDKLAVRIAGNYEESEGNQVKSVNTSESPALENKSARVSIRYQPTDTITVDAMWQKLKGDSKNFTQVTGAGSPGIPADGVPPNYNGPALSDDDYRAVQEIANTNYLETDLITLNANWDVHGHTLSYNFGSQDTDPRPNGVAVDQSNLLIGWDDRLLVKTEGSSYWVSELRLSSIREEDHFLDYDLGVYYHKSTGRLAFESPAALLDGAFGNPFTGPPSPYINQAAIDRYSASANSNFYLGTKNYSAYGNMVFHLTDNTELTAGLRWIHDERPVKISVDLEPGFFAATDLGSVAPCATLDPRLVDSPLYAGVCDFPIGEDPSFVAPPDEYLRADETKTIWNVSLSHNFTDDLLAYTTVGTSWRQGLPSINNQGLPSEFILPDPESATSYEIGVKSSWLGWLRANAAVFQIDYKDQLNQFSSVPYYNSISGSTSSTSIAFFDNVDAKVQGFEAEVSALPIDNLTLTASVSYAKIESEGGEVPCADDSRPLGPNNPINLCVSDSGQTINTAPEWQASFFGSYVLPLGPVDGYARWVVDYQGSNPNFGTSIESASSYTTVDLYFGVTDSDGNWDIGLYGKNVFDEQNQLTINNFTTGYGVDELFGPSGYDTVTTIAQREIGISARYSFGSR